MTCHVRGGKCVCAWMISRKLTKGASPASSWLTTSHNAIWHLFFQMTKTYSLSACLFERMWECVTLPVCALNQAAALRHYTCKHGHGVIYWSHLLSLSAPWTLQRSWVHIFPHTLFAHLLVLFHRETIAGKPPLPWSVSVYLPCNQIIHTQVSLIQSFIGL